MSKNTSQAYQLTLIVLAFVAVVAWCGDVGEPAVNWGLRIGLPLAAAFFGWMYYRAARRPEVLADPLRQVAPKCLERDGLCFAPVVEARTDGSAWLSLYFQNRYAGHASARVALRPPPRHFWIGRHPLPDITGLSVECPGGAFGVVRVPFPVPAKYQGRRVWYDVGADVTYPFRAGKLLRYRAGSPIGRVAQTTRDNTTVIVQLAFGLVLALLALCGRSRVRLALPTGVGETVPAGATPFAEILQLPDLPTNGSPGLRPRVAA